MSLKVAVDLNAVPPTGLGGIGVMDKAAEKLDCLCYGAIGVGGLKMKIHKAAIAQLFLSNDQVLGTEEIYGIGEEFTEGIRTHSQRPNHVHCKADPECDPGHEQSAKYQQTVLWSQLDQNPTPFSRAVKEPTRVDQSAKTD